MTKILTSMAATLALLAATTALAEVALLEADEDDEDEPPAAVAPAAPGPRADSGTLVIVGGGHLPDAVRDRFLNLAGGPQARLVVIPTASAEADRTGVFDSFLYWKGQPAASVVMLHTLDRATADDPAFVQPLRQATGVWLGGGDQERLVAAYRGTRVEKEIRGVLSRGGVVGGTSAGASAMSAVMILGGNPVAQVGDGFGLLPEVVIDQHFHNRHRLPRLLGVIQHHPHCLGLGIDEETAVVVHEHVATVLGNANVRLCLPSTSRAGPDVRVLQAGQRIELREPSLVFPEFQRAAVGNDRVLAAVAQGDAD